MPKKPALDPMIVPREWISTAEIDKAIQKIERRVQELKALDIVDAQQNHTGAIETADSNLRETIREVFGTNSPEFDQHKYASTWSGGYIGMSPQEVIVSHEKGRQQLLGILSGLIGRLNEKREDLKADGQPPTPKVLLENINLHERIATVAVELFTDGHYWEAVFAASKALVNLVKERSGRHDLDGASLMRTVFSRNDPILAFNDLKEQTDIDEQEGMMHLFEGVVLAIRNPGGHAFPDGPQQRAVDYLSLINLLAWRAVEAKKRKKS